MTFLSRPSDSEIARMYTGRTGKRVNGVLLGPGSPLLDVPTAHAWRFDTGLQLMLPVAPRTKKNGGKGGFGGIKQRPAYRAFRDQVVRMLEPLKDELKLPLPKAQYNIAAVFYVDVPGQRADKCGLDQGLYDALEDAGVVTDDWQFRTADGTRIVFFDPRPRVELTITLIPSQE